ncbi:MAG: RimK-like ATPgrasp N-terminal domain-containing protein [Rhodobiaceae bacterium]|nr:RimK-like ATPgrasp N-terminal domain-containing protein [Rhodobiaceae bacterium]
MTGWVIIVDQQKRIFSQRRHAAQSDYGPRVSRPPQLFNRRPKVVNLWRSHSPIRAGYYCSLLAEAREPVSCRRWSRCSDLSERDLYATRRSRLEDAFSSKQARKIGRFHCRNNALLPFRRVRPGL